MWWKMSNEFTTIKITQENRRRLQSLKKGNVDRVKGVDTYDDVLDRMFKVIVR